MERLKKFLRRKKVQEAKLIERREEGRVKSQLEELCGGDDELYRALRWINLDPRGKDPKEYEMKAKEEEKQGKLLHARVNYHVAGSLYLYAGNARSAVKCFSKCSELHKKLYGENSIHEAYEYLKKREGAEKAIPILKTYLELIVKEEKKKE
ncbi:MAG: hypothetical protein QW507_03420 [Candidatus Nanoarchaeia archaeon]|nr:hypothetical protein [Candidatus Haiyanarchaeum thermophilum]MCW1302870.1 hypothetical protein [Candidatus Haiyanarchaeum thermophilum]MCW1303550.1 hypothetical protein [Candidatus Haiyanarchaeum thermophilum]MCW1306232.1 hypothetical protein [Candidatus Haiyanarchaeum thermophilum]MCW1307314.1 hypothetical protein [Candidatus Haiyanarchaeum thermophilum]